ncbi:hypothetical protein AKO1_011078 [Acrasis kona]|uniref:START domain-containing protein n=1 Tax=Acrasis kona TaxID=1008807 RepID=A0AAW2YUG5_9EUKA
MSIISEEDKKTLGSAVELKLKELKHDLSTLDGWTFLKEESGIKSYSITIEGDSNLKVKGGGIIKTNKTPEQFMDWLDEQNCNAEKRKTYDPTIIFREIIDRFGPDWYVFHAGMESGSMMVSNRELLGQNKRFVEGDKVYRVATSCEHESYPEVKQGFVRLISKLNGWYAAKKGEGELEVWYVNHSDPSGYVPAWLVNTRLGTTALSVLKCKNMIENE